MLKSLTREAAYHEPDILMVRRIAPLCLALWLMVMAGIYIFDPEHYANIWLVIGGQLIAGRAYGVSMGVREEYHPFFIVLQASFQDIITLLLLFPMMVVGYRKAARISVIGPCIMNIREKAERQRKRIRPLGAVGLAFFVFLPMWSTGVLPGGIVGHLIGMRTSLTIFAVAVGNTLAVVTWILLFDLMRDFSATLAEWMPFIILVSAILGIAALQILHLRRVWRKRRALRRKQLE